MKFKERMNRQMPSTPRNQHRPPHQQKGQGYYQDDDYAIAHGTRRSAKDGSVYMQKTQQEDPTVSIQIAQQVVYALKMAHFLYLH